MSDNLSEYSEFITNVHSLYARYEDTWDLSYRSFVGSEEYKQGRYLKMFQSDQQTASEVISTYTQDEFGNTTGKYKSRVNTGFNRADAVAGNDGNTTGKFKSKISNNYGGFNRSDAQAGNDAGGTYYNEKIDNVSFYNYVKLIVNEYNAILFKNPAHRLLPETDQMEFFTQNVDGRGNSLPEFFSEVDVLVSVFGVAWLSCVKPSGADTPRFNIHKPLDVMNWEFGFDLNGDQVLN